MLAINPVNLSVLSAQNKNVQKQRSAYGLNTASPDVFVRSSAPKDNYSKYNAVNFRGVPYIIDYYAMGIYEKGALLADDAIRVYKNFKLGNFLDTGSDRTNFTQCITIRSRNLSFLDRIEAPAEKEKFINYFKELTGFPDLYKVSENIKIQFVNALIKSSQTLNKSYCKPGENYYDIVQAGYDGICSVGRHNAFPGSDLDKAYVIIKGYGDAGSRDMTCVKDFKWQLWDNTDQRILSYNHDSAAFPQVYTVAQFNALLKKADEKCAKLDIRKGWTEDDILIQQMKLPRFLDRGSSSFYKYKKLQTQYDKDYVRANKFYIDLCSQFPRYTDKNPFIEPDKTTMKNIGFVIETMRDGVFFTKFGMMDYSRLRESVTFNLTNLSQLNALKARGDMKPKRRARMNIEKDFQSWDIDKQYRFVKTLIEASCANNREFTKEFPQYFTMGGKDLFEPLINKLVQ